jgi:hypothetical protein
MSFPVLLPKRTVSPSGTAFPNILEIKGEMDETDLVVFCDLSVRFSFSNFPAPLPGWLKKPRDAYGWYDRQPALTSRGKIVLDR